MIVSIHQPAYLPWLGLVEKIALADRFVVLDTVQFNARAFQHRTLYSTEEGPRYLTLPVHAAGHQQLGTPIRDIAIADARAMPRHFKTLRQRYARLPGWARIEESLAEILHAPTRMLLDAALATMQLTLRCFRVATPVVLASSVPASGRKGELMLSLARQAGGTTYLSGSGARAYMEPAAFERAGVRLAYQDFRHPAYPQGLRADFQPGCFGLEWFIAQPEESVGRFHADLAESRRRIGLCAA